MNNAMVIGLSWIAVCFHIIAGALAKRRGSAVPYLPAVNIAMAVCVLVYWAERWYGYLFKNISLYLTDQALPAYAFVVVVISSLALAGRLNTTWPHWVVFGIDAVVAIAAALFFSVFKITRLF